MAVIQQIVSAKAQSRKLLVVLVDPDKSAAVEAVCPYLSQADMVLVGGSTGDQCEACVAQLRLCTDRPILLPFVAKCSYSRCLNPTTYPNRSARIAVGNRGYPNGIYPSGWRSKK